MDEIVKLVVEKTGIPDEVARVAVKVVIDYLKTKLPAPIGGQLDDILAGKPLDSAGGLVDKLKGILGG